jgi:hypothetical protein
MLGTGRARGFATRQPLGEGMRMPGRVETIPWESLEDAYGPATDVPALLETFSKANGKKLREATEELCSRVLHQGTIYSSSPPVARVAIDMSPSAKGEKKVILYELLSGFAEAARTALEDGRAVPCCAGGDPVDGAAIREDILAAHQQFAVDLAHRDIQVRSCAADLLTAFPEAGAAGATLVRDRYFVEQNSEARRTLIEGLLRVQASLSDWPAFLKAALAGESDAANRFCLRYAQIQQETTAADDSTVEDLLKTFLQSHELSGGSERFFDSVHLLGQARERAALLQAAKLATDDEGARMIAEHLLRSAFEDQRTGWGQTSRSLLREDGSQPPQMDITGATVRMILRLILWKMFPFVRNWQIRRMRSKPKGMPKVEYRGLKGDAPLLPDRLNQAQQDVLTALADQPAMWKFRTNLWQLFGLPASADDLHRFVRDRS